MNWRIRAYRRHPRFVFVFGCFVTKSKASRFPEANFSAIFVVSSISFDSLTVSTFQPLRLIPLVLQAVEPDRVV
ncbi:MAG: hypothetical protein ACM3U2_07765, partial [Deltaproteobacteria bacterium]